MVKYILLWKTSLDGHSGSSLVTGKGVTLHRAAPVFHTAGNNVTPHSPASRYTSLPDWFFSPMSKQTNKPKTSPLTQNQCPSLAHLLLDLSEDLLLQLGGVVLLQHVVLLPWLSPLLGVFHLLRGQGEVKADALDVEFRPFPTLGPRFWSHLHFNLVNMQKYFDQSINRSHSFIA